MAEAKRKKLTREDLVPGGIYRLKRFDRPMFIDDPKHALYWNNDRYIIGIGEHEIVTNPLYEYPKAKYHVREKVDSFLRKVSHRVDEDGNDYEPPPIAG